MLEIAPTRLLGLSGYGKTVSDFLGFLLENGIRPSVSDQEIAIGRLVIRVIPSVESDPPDRLFMEIPADIRPDEAAVVMTWKASLVGMDALPAFLTRMNASLRAGKEHRENSDRWQIRCSEKGSILSIEARYRP